VAAIRDPRWSQLRDLDKVRKQSSKSIQGGKGKLTPDWKIK